jgi:hypothetical protein
MTEEDNQTEPEETDELTEEPQEPNRFLLYFNARTLTTF